MSTYKERSDYIKTIAMQHKLVAHGKPVAVDSDEPRNSFFRMVVSAMVPEFIMILKSRTRYHWSCI